MFDNPGGILFGQRSRGAPGRRWAFAAAVLATAGCGEPETPAAAELDVDLVSAAAHDPVFEAVEIADRIYATVVRDGISPSRYAASLIVVRTDHVLVVDTREDPVAARRLIETIRAITDLPVRYVVNTHWHGDHVRGNAAFREAFPEVRILGGRVTAEEIAERSRGRLDEEIERATEAIRAVTDRLEAGRTPTAHR